MKPRALGPWAAAAWVLVLVLAASAALAAPPPVGEQERVRWQGAMRTIAVYRPDTAPSGAPLLLALGNAGRSARYALGSWRELADREGFVVAAISSEKPGLWHTPQDGPGLLRVVVRHLQGRYGTDPRRVYLFGADAGGSFVLVMAVLQPRYFAAVASFGGEPQPLALRTTEPLARAVPVRLFVTKRTPKFDLEAVDAAAAVLRDSGADVEVGRLDLDRSFERKGHKVAPRIWAALSAHVLPEAPRYSPSRYER
jgi:poly(3-hydroxybutyrate) depolymerase